MKFEGPEIEYVKTGEPLLVINQNARPVEVGAAITFKQDGMYLVTVRGNEVIVKNRLNRKTGTWIGEGDGYADGNMVYDMWSCGCCGTRFDEWEEEPDWKYCPVCGSHNGGDEDV